MPWGWGAPDATRILTGGELRGPLLSKPLRSFRTETRKGGEFPMNPNNSRCLCHRTLNDPGPKFDTHLGHSCGTVPAHLSGQHPGKNRKALKKIGSLLNTHRDNTHWETLPGQLDRRFQQVWPVHAGWHLLLTPEAGEPAAPQGSAESRDKQTQKPDAEAAQLQCPSSPVVTISCPFHP